MSFLNATVFCKQQTCPSSETLLSYHTCALPPDQSIWVASHVAACDFCGAELQLLTTHTQIEEENVAVEIPLHLRCLAEALLSAGLVGMQTYDDLAYQKEGFTFTDA